MLSIVMDPMILTEEIAIGNEVQAHGFKWEKQLLHKVYHATTEEIESIGYTCPHDLPSHLNRLDGSNLSIKTTGKANTVCMADALRVYDAVTSEPIHLVVIHYVQKGNTKSISSIVEMDLTDSKEILFGSLTRLQVEQLDALVKLVPGKRKPTQEEKTTQKTLRDSLQPLSGAIYFNIKCNSTQSRVQCSFNRFQEFIKKNPERIIARSETNEFRGGSIDPDIVSGRRKFKPKVESHLTPN